MCEQIRGVIKSALENCEEAFCGLSGKCLQGEKSMNILEVRINLRWEEINK